MAKFDAAGDEIDYDWLERAQPVDANGDKIWPENPFGTVRTHWIRTYRNRFPILEIDMEGNILRTLVNNPITDVLDVRDLDDDGDTTEPNPHFGEAIGGWWAAGGITIDPISGNLWVTVDMQERILEVDIDTGIPTGLTCPQPEIGRLPARQGGLTGIPKGDPGSYASFWDMIPFTNVAGDDFFTVVRMHQYPGLNGTKEAFLEGTVGSVPLSGKIFNPTSKPPIAYLAESILKIDLNSNGNVSRPALLMFDLNQDVQTDASTSLALGLLPELRVHSAFSSPADNGLAFQFPWATGALLSIPTNLIPVVTGDLIRVQAVYFHPLSQYSPGLMVTNELWFGGVGVDQIVMEANGDSSRNADTSRGFFRFEWKSGPDIVKVLIDMGNSKSNAVDMRNNHFSIAEPNMADQFYLGNSTMPGATGTYRNNSDALVGLVYDPNVNSNPPSNSPIVDYYVETQGLTYDSGFIQHDPWSGAYEYQALEFNFTDFGLDGAGNPAAGPEVFEFDVRVEHLNGQSGGFYKGMIVEITLSDGTVFKAELLPDAEISKRAFIGW
jgi:hypothetical protein